MARGGRKAFRVYMTRIITQLRSTLTPPPNLKCLPAQVFVQALFERSAIHPYNCTYLRAQSVLQQSTNSLRRDTWHHVIVQNNAGANAFAELGNPDVRAGRRGEGHNAHIWDDLFFSPGEVEGGGLAGKRVKAENKKAIYIILVRMVIYVRRGNDGYVCNIHIHPFEPTCFVTVVDIGDR